jgi:hypothetical protein
MLTFTNVGAKNEWIFTSTPNTFSVAEHYAELLLLVLRVCGICLNYRGFSQSFQFAAVEYPIGCCLFDSLYRAFNNVVRDYKHL